MKPKQFIKTFLFILVTGYLLSMISCSEIGTQPPVWKSGMFSPDGKYYVYTWTEMYITQYSKRGNSTFRSGSSTTYLQIIDCTNGQKLLSKPLKSAEMLTIADIENNHVWLVSYEISKRWAPACRTGSPAVGSLVISVPSPSSHSTTRHRRPSCSARSSRSCGAPCTRGSASATPRRIAPTPSCVGPSRSTSLMCRSRSAPIHPRRRPRVGACRSWWMSR